MTTNDATGGALDGAVEADQEGLPPPWWLNLWVLRLRERGSLKARDCRWQLAHDRDPSADRPLS